MPSNVELKFQTLLLVVKVVAISLFNMAPPMVYIVVPPAWSVDLPVVVHQYFNTCSVDPDATMSLTFNEKRATKTMRSALALALVSKPASVGAA